MATLLNEATDSWSFDRLIQPLSNSENLQDLLAFLSSKHASHQHEHIDPVALSRILMSIKFITSKKRLFLTLKPLVDELILLLRDILQALRHDKKLDDPSSPWLWLESMLVLFHHEDHSFPHFNLKRTSNKLRECLQLHRDNNNNGGGGGDGGIGGDTYTDQRLPQFFFPEWSFTTKRGIQLFAHNFIDTVHASDDDDGDDDEDDDDDDAEDLFGETSSKKKKSTKSKLQSKSHDSSKPKSRTLCNVKFLSFPRPAPPQSATSTLDISAQSYAQSTACEQPMRKRHKTSATSYVAVAQGVGSTTPTAQLPGDHARMRKFSAINDKLSKMMNQKNEKKSSIRFLSIQQKRQMREDSDRREQERRYQVEQTRLEKERLKKLEKERHEREEKERQLLTQGVKTSNHNGGGDGEDEDLDLDDFDAFMSNAKTDDAVPMLTAVDAAADPDGENIKQQQQLQMEANLDPLLSIKQQTSCSSSDDESIADMLVVPGSELEAMVAAKTKEEVVVPQVDAHTQKLLDLGIPQQLHSYKWLYENCNQLTQDNRDKIVRFLTAQYHREDVAKEDVVLNRSTDADKGITKDTVFRMDFESKKWKKVALSKKIKKK